MTQEQLDKMRKCVTDPKIDAKTVKITCNDGDVLEGFIEFVSDEERDAMYGLPVAEIKNNLALRFILGNLE